MAKANLRAVPTDQEISDELADELVAAIGANPPAPPKRTVRTMIASTSQSLKKLVDDMRAKEAELEGIKAAANVEFERKVTAARLVRDNRHEEADADLHQLRSTISVLDPARAKLAESANTMQVE